MHNLKSALTQYPVEIWVHQREDCLFIDKLVVEKEYRNQGIGTQVMGEIIRYAKNNQLKVALSPSGSFGGSISRLRKFYKSFGFTRNKDYSINEELVLNLS